MSDLLINVVIAIVTTGISVAVSAWYFRKSYRVQDPCYLIEGSQIVSGHTVANSGLEIKFPGYGQPVDNVTVSRVHLWNAGKERIDKSDVVKTNPLRIVTKSDALILDVSLIQSNNPDCRIEVQRNQERTSATITFDFLGQNDGGMIQIVHSGRYVQDIDISGGIKGLRLRRIEPTSISRTLTVTAFAFAMSVYALLTAAIGVIVCLALTAFMHPVDGELARAEQELATIEKEIEKTNSDIVQAIEKERPSLGRLSRWGKETPHLKVMDEKSKAALLAELNTLPANDAYRVIGDDLNLRQFERDSQGQFWKVKSRVREARHDARFLPGYFWMFTLSILMLVAGVLGWAYPRIIRVLLRLRGSPFA